MKKIISLLLCLILLTVMAVPAHAEDSVDSQKQEISPQENGSQEGNGENESDEDEQDQTGGDQKEDDQQEKPHEHSWTVTDTATCGANGTITKECACGEKETAESPATGKHQWNAGEITTEANCQQEGVKTYTCTVCNSRKTETLPMESTHDYGAWSTDGTGHIRTCDDCLLEDSGTHSWKEEITKQPTCKEDGAKVKSCTVCNYKESILLTKLTVHTYDSACDPECNVCEREREIEHDFNKTWSKDEKSHWHECTKCGAKKDKDEHDAGPAATEEKAQVCLTCAYVIAPKKSHVHSYGKEWTSDEVGHWHACTGCDEEKDYSSHKFSDDCDSDCNTCGYERENSHSYDKVWETSNFEHWQVCTVCGEESEHEKHAAGPEATDKDPQICTICQFELSPKLEHTHDFGSEYAYSKDNHWKECQCGEQSVPEPHTWDKGRDSGRNLLTYRCTVCDAEKTEEAPSTGFPWIIVILVILAMVCAGGIAVLVIILKRGGFEEDSDNEEEIIEEEDGELAADSEADEEEKLIDDYFASLDQDFCQ